ncbi:MAG: GNAT family N-acetyltransferase [Brachymonas denitrificans]|uniref:GNAT family N-acetyltransferase n=1 Tax=Brachymonas denitrificans TaxID=28220 RepID=UPI00352CAA50
MSEHHPPPKIRLQPVDTPELLQEARRLMQEYADSLDIDLDFQGFAEELAALPGAYAQPQGTLLLALVDGAVAGGCALRPLPETDYADAAEMKRLYVRPMFRGFGLGRLLTEGILDAARMAGYQHVLLDTLDDMESARALYEELGFVEIPPYYHNPVAGSHYLMAEL